MSSTGKPATAAPTAGTVLTGLGVQLGNDGLATLKGLLKTAQANIDASPTWETVVAQFAQVSASAVLAAPSLASEGIKQANASLGALINLIPDDVSTL